MINVFDNRYSRGYHTTGTDIEFALVDETGNYKAAIPFIEGTKKNPQFLEGGNVQKDNVAMEIAVDYAYTKNDFLEQTAHVLHNLYTDIIPKGWDIKAIPSAMFPDEELTDPIAQEFGCDPDFDAKSGNTNEMDLVNVHPNFRSFGLHVHTGVGSCTALPNAMIYIMLSDMILGMFSTMVDNSKAALERRKLYGKPSAFRLKPYGVEYRTLSNFWVQSPKTLAAIYTLNDLTTKLYVNEYITKQLFRTYDITRIADIIKNGDKAAATNVFTTSFWHYLHDQDKELLQSVMEQTEYGSIKEEWEEYFYEIDKYRGVDEYKGIDNLCVAYHAAIGQ